jgi:hypothetical protein
MGGIRPFVEADIPRVARLHRTVFKTDDRVDSSGLDSYHAYFTRVFLDHPARDASLPSLVCQESGGRIVGFLGVVPRRMTMNGRRYQAAIASQFIVDPTTQVGPVAVRLAKTFLEGPQDLSISDEANDISRRIWEGLGGTTALLRSLYWTRPLRPARLGLSVLRGRARLAVLAMAARPVASIVDVFATRMPHSHFHQPKPQASAGNDRIEETVLSYLPEFTRKGSLRVEYDEPTLRWLLDQARLRKAVGKIHTGVVRNAQRIIGWYLYHLDRDHIASVLQVVADPAAIRDVLDHLFYQANEHGAIAVTGRLEPRYLQTLSDAYCLLHRRGPWVLLNSEQSELVRSFETGDAFFSRLDGEWCLGY